MRVRESRLPGSFPAQKYRTRSFDIVFRSFQKTCGVLNATSHSCSVVLVGGVGWDDCLKDRNRTGRQKERSKETETTHTDLLFYLFTADKRNASYRLSAMSAVLAICRVVTNAMGQSPAQGVTSSCSSTMASRCADEMRSNGSNAQARSSCHVGSEKLAHFRLCMVGSLPCLPANPGTWPKGCPVNAPQFAPAIGPAASLAVACPRTQRP